MQKNPVTTLRLILEVDISPTAAFSLRVAARWQQMYADTPHLPNALQPVLL